jgi:hypothetical protein
LSVNNYFLNEITSGGCPANPAEQLDLPSVFCFFFGQCKKEETELKDKN